MNLRLLTPGIRIAVTKTSALLGLCLICTLPLRATNPDGSSSQEPPAAAQGAAGATSSQPAQSGAGPVEAASASHYAPLPDPSASASTTVASAPQAAAPAAAPAPDPDGWTFATYINTWLPHYLHFSGEFRNREEGRGGFNFTPGNDYTVGLFRVRVGLDFTPTSWLHGFVQARDAQFIGATPSSLFSNAKDVFDLNQAYVELRNGEHGWFSLKTGRQEIYFGDERLVARSLWSNASRSFDAARLTLRGQSHGAVLDVFASSVVKNYPTSWDHVLAGQNFYGLNGSLTKLVSKATIEPYVYLKALPAVTGADKKTGNERLYTSGLRWSGTIPGGFDYRARYSYQSGHYADNSIHAWAYYGILGYTIPNTRLEPRFSIEYNYASGNRSIGSSVTGTFDQLYPTTHQWRRITDLFGEQNIKDLKPGFDFKPLKKMKVYVVYSDLSLASRYDSLYNNSGSVLVKVPKGGAVSTAIGKEGDFYGTYDVNRRLQFGAGLGYLWAGQFLKQNTPGANSTYPYAFVDYYF